MRPKFLGPKAVEPPVEPAEFDDYDREVLRYFGRGVIWVLALILGMTSTLAWLSK